MKPLGETLQEFKTDTFRSYDIGRMAEIINALQQGNINAYFFCNKAQVPEYLAVYVGKMKCKFDILCWHKQNCPPSFSNKYMPDTEYILFFHKGKGHTHPANYYDARTWFVQGMNTKDKKTYGHATVKPLNIVQTLIKNSSVPGDRVLDMFMGTGTTGVAAQILGRDFVGIEREEQWFKVAQERLSAVQGQLFV